MRWTKTLCAALCACLLAPPALAQYVPTNRDTRYSDEKAQIQKADLSAYTLLYENSECAYWYREDRDVIAAVDKRSGYTWKTGLDAGFSSGIKKAVKAAETPEALQKAAEPIEKNLNARYTGIANSILTAEYYEAETVKYISSASEEGSSSSLSRDGQDNRFRLDVDFYELKLNVQVFITFDGPEIRYDIPFESIRGEGKARLSALWITPFLGAAGGEAEFFDPQTGGYAPARRKYQVPGYVLVPDGSGSLIRFADNSVSFNEYTGDVYGPDPSTATYNYRSLTDAVELKNPLIPVFGIAHGSGQAAFAAWAAQGAEHMQIVVRPEENLRMSYTWAYPRFEYNSIYFKQYNRYGDGYFTLMDEPYSYDVSMTYRFLAGEDADWAGMARAYRARLMADGFIARRQQEEGDIPLRIDFIMSDMKKSLIGSEQVVVTTAGDARAILDTLLSDGISNLSSGLLNWQKGASVLSRPDRYVFAPAIGRQKDFETLISDFAKKNVDVSLARDFSRINTLMTRYSGTAAQHAGTWYAYLDAQALYGPSVPVSTFGFARPDTAVKWLDGLLAKAASAAQSITVQGISGTLVSTHNRRGPLISVTQAAALYAEALSRASERIKINLDAPNLYLWPYTDRFLQMPVTGSQYVFETDTVPFLQMVLSGTAEVFAPYSNFSFYTRSDALRMIDYNISPSFVLSKQPSHLLLDTLSSDLYSTEFDQYRTLIGELYRRVNGALSKVRGFEWTDRTMLDEGVALNSYERDGERAYILINYTSEEVTHMGVTAAPLDCRLIKGGNAP